VQPHGGDFNNPLHLFNRRFAIHGESIHRPASQKKKKRWFVYACEDIASRLIYVRSTRDACSRWAQTKRGTATTLA
jgi:hypothetical protein